jgi:hypothetical protein
LAAAGVGVGRPKLNPGIFEVSDNPPTSFTAIVLSIQHLILQRCEFKTELLLGVDPRRSSDGLPRFIAGKNAPLNDETIRIWVP